MSKGDIGCLFIIAICLFLIGFFVGLIYNDELSNGKIKAEASLSDNCTNLNLFNTTKCLNNELRNFYYYNLSNKNNKLSDEQLKAEGGVCWHYAEWYQKQAEKLGFYAKTVSMSINETLAHEVAIISNQNGYCIADQLTVRCQELK